MSRDKNDSIVHPGAIVKARIKSMGMEIKRVAEEMDISRNTLQLLLAGKGNITPRIAVSLSDVIGRGDMYWLSLQADYDVKLARKHWHKKHRVGRRSRLRPDDIAKSVDALDEPQELTEETKAALRKLLGVALQAGREDQGSDGVLFVSSEFDDSAGVSELDRSRSVRIHQFDPRAPNVELVARDGSCTYTRSYPVSKFLEIILRAVRYEGVPLESVREALQQVRDWVGKQPGSGHIIVAIDRALALIPT